MDGDSLLGRFGFYLVIQLVSVFSPGILLLVELIALGVALAHPAHTTVDASLMTIKELTGAFGAGAFLLLLIVGYLLGYVAQQVGFNILALAETIRGNPTRAATRERLVGRFGEEIVARAEDRHPVLRLLPVSRQVVGRKRPGHHRVQSANIGSDAAFAYSKLWLRRSAPALNVDALEIEINALTGLLVPVVVLIALAVTVPFFTSTATLVLVLVLAGIWVMLLNTAMVLRAVERWDAVSNLVLDTCMDDARYSAGALSLPAQREPIASEDDASGRALPQRDKP